MKYDELTGQFNTAVEYGSAYVLMLAADLSKSYRVPMRIGETFTLRDAQTIDPNISELVRADGTVVTRVVVDQYCVVLYFGDTPLVNKITAVYSDMVRTVVIDTDRPYTKADAYSWFDISVLPESDAVSINGESSTFPLELENGDVVVLGISGGVPVDMTKIILNVGAFMNYNNQIQFGAIRPVELDAVEVDSSTIFCSMAKTLVETDTYDTVKGAFQWDIFSYSSSQTSRRAGYLVNIAKGGETLALTSFSGSISLHSLQGGYASRAYKPDLSNTLAAAGTRACTRDGAAYSCSIQRDDYSGGVLPANDPNLSGFPSLISALEAYDAITIGTRSSGALTPWYGGIGVVGSFATDPNFEFTISYE